jgi:hypothetical protein
MVIPPERHYELAFYISQEKHANAGSQEDWIVKEACPGGAPFKQHVHRIIGMGLEPW